MKAVIIAALLLTGCAREVAVVKGVEPVAAGSLAGGPWIVEDINGGGVIDNARIDISFDPGSRRVQGRSGCNRFGGGWQQDGATIRLGPLAGTRMMCPPALMDTEQKFLAALEAATLVSFDETGAAMLKSPDGRVVKLRRETR